MNDKEWSRPARIAAEKVGSFLNWWGRELAACVPRGLPAWLGLDRHAVWISLRESSAVFFVGRGPDRTVEISFDPDHPELQAVEARAAIGEASGPVGMILPLGAVLRPTVTLPIAALENLREVAGFEMDRHTPFRAADVFYDVRLVETDRQAGQVTVDLAVAPKDAVNRVLAVAAAWGMSVDRITVADDDAPEGASFNLLPEIDRQPVRRSLRRLITAEVALVCVLAAIAVFLPIKQKHDALATAEVELSELRGEAAAVGDLRDEIAAISSQIAALIEERETRPAAVALLDETSRLLPDGTWLTELIWDDSGLNMTGFSDQPSRLIAVLEASPLFSEVRFNAPVTAASEVGRERFHIITAVDGVEDTQ